ncbi:hypothetical protein [Nocardiopsis rhodophaea]|uniref:hypothetical protein n=1 Tax=Nocardiopsis rhodophaea TaxID=280238 RepID=UPI0031D0ED3E
MSDPTVVLRGGANDGLCLTSGELAQFRLCPGVIAVPPRQPGDEAAIYRRIRGRWMHIGTAPVHTAN